MAAKLDTYISRFVRDRLRSGTFFKLKFQVSNTRLSVSYKLN